MIAFADRENPAWMPEEIERLRVMFESGVPEREYERFFPGRSKGAIKEAALRFGFVRGAALDDAYISLDEAERRARAARKTMLSIIEYANRFGAGVRRRGSSPRIVFHQQDLSAAIDLWNAGVTLRELSFEVGVPYSTLQSRLQKLPIAFRSDVKPSHRRMSVDQWLDLFERGDPGYMHSAFESQ